MITPDEIRKKAERKYSHFLSAVLTRTPFFPLQIKGKKGKATDSYEYLFKNIKRLLESEKQQIGYGYTVRLKKVNTRQAGIISMPEAIFFENVEDYVKFIEKEMEFLAFRKAVQITHKKLPELKKWMATAPLKVINYLSVWNDLIEVCIFLVQNPQPNLYTRSLPIPVSPTFVENHQPILTEMLNSILPSQSINPAFKNFERRFGFRYDEPTIRIRALKEDFQHFPTTDLTLPLSEWNKLNFTVSTVFLVSDKLNFLRFPIKEDAIVVLFTKKMNSQLKDFLFLKNKKIHFWGDISITGLEQLSELRTVFPKAMSFLMSLDIFKKYEEYVETTSNNLTLFFKNLTISERTLIDECLKGGYLLQKHIEQKDIEKAIVSRMTELENNRISE